MASILKTDKIEGVTASGTVQMPAGHVVQVARTYSANSSYIQTTSTSLVASGVQCSLTPKFSNSKLLLLASGGLRYNADTTGNAGYAQVRIIDATNSNTQVAYTKYGMYAYTGGYIRSSGHWTCMSYINASSTSLRRYTCQYYFDGAQTYYYGTEGDSITVMEIKV